MDAVKLVSTPEQAKEELVRLGEECSDGKLHELGSLTPQFVAAMYATHKWGWRYCKKCYKQLWLEIT